MSDNKLTSELLQAIVERLNTLTTTAPDIEFAFVFSSAGEPIAHSKLWDNAPDLKAISPMLAEMAATSVELVHKLRLRELPPTEPFYEHIIFMKSSDGYVVIMPINHIYWLTSVVRYHSMLGVIMLDSYRASDDLAKLLPSTPSP